MNWEKDEYNYSILMADHWKSGTHSLRITAHTHGIPLGGLKILLDSNQVNKTFLTLLNRVIR